MIQSIVRADTPMTSSAYRLAPHVIFLRLQDGSARLLDLGGNIYAISQTGAQMLNETLLVGAATAAVRIATEYDIEISHIQNDLYIFLRDLEKKRLLFSPQRHRGTCQMKKLLACLILLPLLRYISAYPCSLERKTWVLLALASVALRIFGWPHTLVSWQRAQGHAFPQKHALDRAPAGPGSSVKKIDNVVRHVAAHHLFPVECKERALACWWLLSARGFSAQVVLGISLFPLECHCWCEVGPLVLSDDQEHCKQFMPILRS